jgi:hypothetical protein
MRQNKSGKPGILHGLDSDNIIPTPEIGRIGEDAAEEYSTPTSTNACRHTTRQTIHGRQDALYDVKYHPMDDVVRPVNAAKHRFHAVTRSGDSDDEGDIMSSVEPGSAIANEEERPPKRRRGNGTKRSNRASNGKFVNYNTQHHPQDDLLRLIDRDIVPTRNAARKKKLLLEPVVISEDSSSSSEETIEQPRWKRPASRRFDSDDEIPNSISSQGSESDDPDRLLDEIYAAPEVRSDLPHEDGTGSKVHAQVIIPINSHINDSILFPDRQVIHLQNLPISRGRLGPSQHPKSSLVDYSDSDSSVEQTDVQQDGEEIQEDETDFYPSDADLLGVSKRNASQQKILQAIKKVVPGYLSGTSFSSQVSTGQPGKPFSKARVKRRAAPEPFQILQDPEVKTISLAQRAVTELMARESDPPKENLQEVMVDEAFTPSELDARSETPLPVLTHINVSQDESRTGASNAILLRDNHVRTPPSLPASSLLSDISEAVLDASPIAKSTELSPTNSPTTTRRVSDSSFVSDRERWRLSPSPRPSQFETPKSFILEELTVSPKTSIRRSASLFQEVVRLEPSRSMSIPPSGNVLVDDSGDISTAAIRIAISPLPAIMKMPSAQGKMFSSQVTTVEIRAELHHGSKDDNLSKTNAIPEVGPKIMGGFPGTAALPGSPWKARGPEHSILQYHEDVDSQHFDDAMDNQA